MSVDELEWESVESSNIEAIAYNEELAQICVRFKDGSAWAYNDCNRQLYEQFRIAPSVGKFFHANIKNGHTSERI